MKNLTTSFNRIETNLQSVVEGRLAKLFPTFEYREKFLLNLISTMRSGIQTQENGTNLAPDSYVLLVSKDVYSRFETHSQLLKDLAGHIKDFGETAGLSFTQHPQVSFSTNADVMSGSIDVIAHISFEEIDETEEIGSFFEGGNNNLPSNSFLIVNGEEVFPLDQSLVNIGRSSENDLIIRDGRISRNHAQLRAIRGKYVLSDLNSTGGTYVNGHRITQQRLTPNDVLSFAGVPVVYSQDRQILGSTAKMNTKDPVGENRNNQDKEV